jgi:hypothetical protein
MFLRKKHHVFIVYISVAFRKDCNRGKPVSPSDSKQCIEENPGLRFQSFAE